MHSKEGVETIKTHINKKNHYLGEFFNIQKLEELFSSKKKLDYNFLPSLEYDDFIRMDESKLLKNEFISLSIFQKI